MIQIINKDAIEHAKEVAKCQEYKGVMLCHICNDIGAWGAGFSGVVSSHWKVAEDVYREWNSKGQFEGTNKNALYEIGDNKFKLGNVQLVLVENRENENIFVCNMVGQSSIRKRKVKLEIYKLYEDSTIAEILNHKGVEGINVYAPFDYIGTIHCLKKVEQCASKNNLKVVMPKIGAGYAGGDWNIILEMIESVITDGDICILK